MKILTIPIIFIISILLNGCCPKTYVILPNPYLEIQKNAEQRHYQEQQAEYSKQQVEYSRQQAEYAEYKKQQLLK